MVQTKDGATENPWITYMRKCAANYKAGPPVEAYPLLDEKKSQSGQESPCTCQSSPQSVVQPASHAKRKRAVRVSEASKIKQTREVDTAIRKEKSQAQKMKKERATGLQSIEADTQKKSNLNDYAHSTARATNRATHLP